MMASSKLAVFTIVFSVACAVIYVISTELNLPLLTYHPVIVEVDFLWTPERRGPAMYWYGWMLTSLIGALALATTAITVPESWVQRASLFGTLYLRQGDGRIGISKVPRVVAGRGARGGGGDQFFRARQLEPAAVAGMGVCRPDWGACRLGVLSHALFYTLGYLGGAWQRDAQHRHARRIG
jgi:hypothetical protein